MANVDHSRHPIYLPYTICTKSLIHYFWNSDFEFYIATLILRHLNNDLSYMSNQLCCIRVYVIANAPFVSFLMF